VSKEFGEYASSWIDLLFTWKTEEVLFPTKLTSLERKWVHNYVQDNFDDLLQTLSVEKDGSISTSNKKRKKYFVKKSLHVQIEMIITWFYDILGQVEGVLEARGCEQRFGIDCETYLFICCLGHFSLQNPSKMRCELPCIRAEVPW